jgi:RNA polymerase sigma factor (sigma-70 family)
MNFTERELQLTKNIAYKQSRNWSNVEYEDLHAELMLWLVQKYVTVLRYREEEGGEGKLYVSLNRAATKYAAKEQSYYNGASVTTQQKEKYAYSFTVLDNALQYFWNYKSILLSSTPEHPQHGTSTVELNTENDIQTIMLDIDMAFKKLNPAEQILLEYRFKENKTFNEIGSILSVSDNAARMRINRLISKLQRLIG